MANTDALPSQAFDGQVFIDAFRVKWKFDGSTQCWKKIGKCPDIPVASEIQTGLLSSQLKQVLDSIPAGGGHFGILAQPLLSLVPQGSKPLHKGKISKISPVASGTQLQENLERAFTPEQFAGKILIFKTGLLTKKAFLVFTNDENSIFLEGDATAAQANDEFEIVSSGDLNPNGVLLGDIMLVSESIDITCVDGEGLPLTSSDTCNVDIIKCDDPSNNPPGLNFQINQDFLDSLCVIVPGCKGSRGDRGEQGDPGLDGTGDGPQGEQGDPGEDAPTTGNSFTGIKILDVDDIYDTAVVSIELDADNGKLNLIKAKVRTPDSSTPATQLVSTPINRAVVFDDNSSFDYTLMKPSVDPIDELDPDILKYPAQFVKSEIGSAPRTTTVNKIKLSDIVDAVISYYDGQLVKINDNYNQQLKSYIESKDESARRILASLAQQVAECEFELPIDFCLGISPDDCHPNQGTEESFDFVLADQLLALPTDGDTVTGISLGKYLIPATSTDGIPKNDPYISVKYPSNLTQSSTSTLPAGFYIVKIMPEGSAIRSNSTNGWIINDPEVGVGLEAQVRDGETTPVVVSGNVPSIKFNALEKSSVEKAYAEADYTEQVVCVELTEAGRISLSAFVPGDAPQGAVNVEVLRLNAPEGSALL